MYILANEYTRHCDVINTSSYGYLASTELAFLWRLKNKRRIKGWIKEIVTGNKGN